MSGTCSRGILLIEVLVAIALVVLMATLFVPRFPYNASDKRRAFVGSLNMLMRFTWHQAIKTQKVHKVLFDFHHDKISVMRKKNTKDAKGAFESVASAYMHARMVWPSNFTVKKFFVQGYDEMQRFARESTTAVWIYIMPSGYAQEASIEFVDSNDNNRLLQLKLNPFLVQFKMDNA